MDIFSLLSDQTAIQHLRELDAERAKQLDWKPFREARTLMESLPDPVISGADGDHAAIRISQPYGPDDPRQAMVAQAARAMMPWKKGPYRLCGIEIDAEWRSDLKWDRLKPALPELTGRTVLDVGCNNGYYMFRMLPQEPAFVLGIDPVPRLWYQYQLLQHFAQIPQFDFRMWGWQELEMMPQLFDVIFCMGIIYHHSDPIRIIRGLYQALKPGGTLVLESIIIPGENPDCLFPEERYARMRNVWFVPTLKAMCHFLTRCRFKNIQTVAVNRHEPEEQRTTPWNPGPSYADFIDPNCPEKTIEGYPAPYRAIVTAQR